MGSLGATRRFALGSTLAVLGTGLVVHLIVRESFSEQAAAASSGTARVVAEVVVEQLGAERGWDGLGTDAAVQLDRLVDASSEISMVEVYDADGVLRHSTGASAPTDPAQVERALAGRTVGRAVPGRALFETHVPTTGQDGQRTGVVAVRLSVEEVRADAARNETLLLGSLLLCLTVLWLLMGWLSRSVSRTLRRRSRTHERRAATDDLTGLPNRRQLVTELDRAVASDGGALLLVDVDHFKEVNDSLGHAVGDQLLRAVAHRLAQALPEARVARLGGDEFAVLVPGAGTSAQAGVLAGRACEAMTEPVDLDGVVLNVSLSVGAALAPQHAGSTSDLLRRADVAMYAAKQSGTGPRVYVAELDRHEPDRLALLGDLRRALDAGELSLVYQPTYDLLRDGRFLAVEALVRWDHPERGAVPPEELVALCERSGQIRALTRWVLDQALAQWRRWADDGMTMHLAVNLSGRNLAEDDLPTSVAELLAHHGVPAEKLILEITEGAFVPDPERASAVVRRLDDLGVNVSVDDFGTGWSSMSRLMQMPLKALKVDRSFVADLPAGPGAAVAAATIRLGHDLGLWVVAEGVESAEQLVRLRELGCDVAQGYLLSPGVPAAQVPALAARRCGVLGLEPLEVAAQPTA